MSSEVISLGSRKRKTDKLRRKRNLDPDTRIQELEEDVMRLIDCVTDLQSDLDTQREKFMKLLHLLQQERQ